MNLSEVDTFLDYVKKKGVVAPNTVGSWSAALSGIKPVLDGDEERTVDYVLDNGDVIQNRLQNQNTDISGATIKVYITRSQRALKNFLEWKNDRDAWEKKQASKTRKERKATPKQNKKAEQATDSQVNSEKTFSSSKRVLPIPTGNGAQFEVGLPDTYYVDDLVRVMWGLAIYAEDFDPKDVLDRFGKPPAPAYNREAQVVQQGQITT